MIAALAMPPSINFRDSNTAGAPLPLLPRRSSSSRFSLPSTSAIPQNPSPTITLVVQRATPPSDDEAESSSSSSDGRPTIALRPRGGRNVRPPEESTPTPTPVPFPSRRRSPPPTASGPDDTDETPRPALRPLVYTPGTGSVSGLRALSTSHLPALGLSSPPSPPKATDDTPRIIRKKSGQPVKSSLKSSTHRVRGSLEVVIGSSVAGSSKSAPSTPTAGTRSRVHFDSQLEHVKLFLAEQKPLAVSRDGSPTDDTSGTEDFPDYIFGRAREREEEGRLEMFAPIPPPAGELDVRLQTLMLADDRTAVVGTVAVRNLAFDKWVAVRFTLDDWQTTSEVTGRYTHSLPGGKVDVFAFTIRLNDVLARIDGKEMMLAVRYNCAGREMWDNNGGRNYRATFKRVRDGEREEKAMQQTEKEPTTAEGEVAADLRSRLEHVVKTQAQLSAPAQLRNVKKSAEAPAAIGFRAGGSLRARYDFNASSRAPWSPHQRAQSHPKFDSPSPPSSISWPRTVHQKTWPMLGSPRDSGEDPAFRPAPYDVSGSEDVPFSSPMYAITVPKRHHQRGYFDMPLRDVGSLRRTPPGTPRLDTKDDTPPLPLVSPGRSISFPPLDPRAGLGSGLGFALELEARLMPRRANAVREENGSEDSTPSIVSDVSSGTMSPVSPPDTDGVDSPSMYHSFLDKFCFYTGSGRLVEGLPRTQSASSVEELLSVASASPSLSSFVAKKNSSPPRFDDSGSSTPTSRFSPVPRAATPIAA